MLESGQILNDTYKVERLLGSGGMAHVYAVVHLRMPRKFALKEMHEQASTPEVVERFQQEADILAEVRHPHIVEVTDVNRLPSGNPYLVMELLEGEDLSKYLARTGPLSVGQARRILAQIGSALEAAHQRGITHRDLKPSNIFLLASGPTPNFVKVLDFGVAKVARENNKPITGPLQMMGTPGYMAPEQARADQEKIGPATDQFALAAIFYEMLTGKAAFFRPGEGMYATLERVVFDKVEPLEDDELNQAVQKALSKDPKHRFPSIREFLLAAGCEGVVENRISTLDNSTGTLSAVGRSRPFIQTLFHRKKRQVMAAAAALCLLGFTFVVAKRGRPSSVQVTPSMQPTQMQIIHIEKSAPETKQPKNGPKPADLPKPPAVPPTPTQIVIGPAGSKNPKVREAIRSCIEKHLASLHLKLGAKIRLQRSNYLSVVKAPDSVLDSGFNNCLRQRFAEMAMAELPRATNITVEKQTQ